MPYCTVVEKYIKQHPSVTGMDLWQHFKDTNHINSYRSARRYRQWYDRGRSAEPCQCDMQDTSDHVTFEEQHKSAIAQSTSSRIKTLDQLLQACQVDMSLWRVDRWIANKWEVAAKGDNGLEVEPLIQIKAWLVAREEAPVEMALEDLIDKVRQSSPRVHSKPHLKTGEYLLVPNLYDSHFNKRSVDHTYTPQQAASDFKAVGDAVVERVKIFNLAVDRILFPVGNDALHADTLSGTTTHGTWVELAGDQRLAVDAVIDAYRYVISRLAEIAPVDVLVVESNHDRFSSYWLGKVLEAVFENHADVQVDASSHPRKYYRYGKTLLAFEHGDKVRPRDLASLMATEAKEDWAQSTYREWLRGHIHHNAGMYYPITSDGGVTVRVIPALCPTDHYHLLRGFVGEHRAAETLYYHHEYGPSGNFPIFVDEVSYDY